MGLLCQKGNTTTTPCVQESPDGTVCANRRLSAVHSASRDTRLTTYHTYCQKASYSLGTFGLRQKT